MGSTNVSKAVSKWKYGLKLVRCGQCINEATAPLRCNQCNNYGEYWVTATGTPIQMGQLWQKVDLASL